MNRPRTALVVCIVSLVLVAPAAAQVDIDAELDDALSSDGEIQGRLSEQDALAGRQVELETTIDVLSLDAEEITAEIARLELEIRATESQLEAARADRLAALDAEVAAIEGAREAEADVAALTELVKDRAVAAFIQPHDEQELLGLTDAAAAKAPIRRVLLAAVAERDDAVLHELTAARAAVDDLRAEADAASHDAAALAQTTSELLVDLQGSTAEQELLKAELEARIAAYTDEVVALEAARAEVAALIAEREAQLRAQVERRARQAERCAAGFATDVDGTPLACGLATGTRPGSIGWPAIGPVTSEFGPRWGRMHEGIDIAADSGVPVVAAASGEAYFVGWISGYGNTVLVDHGGGMHTLYAHNSAFAVDAGAIVTAGQVISYVGSTGNSTGPHLHFEVQVDGVAQDPRLWLG